MTLTSGWRVTQDVRQLGERIGWYEPQFVTPELRAAFDKLGVSPDFPVDWQPIDRLVHLQLLLAPQPYFGRSLRYFNESPWWYRLEFSTSELDSGATLRFEGVDYFAKVWLNGTLLGEHEGYADPFQFEVGSLIRKDRPNVLVVKVSSPWDHQYLDPALPAFSAIRNLLKGSYEHADGFVQRDVNPVGIWRPVRVIFHENLHAVEEPSIATSLVSDQQTALVSSEWSVMNDGQPQSAHYVVRIRAPDTKKELARVSRSVELVHGTNRLAETATIVAPQLWTTWDRGAQPLYEAVLELVPAHGARLKAKAPFGIRTVELHRSVDETRFIINGKPLYLRGTTYWPDLYLSNMSRSRYERDVQAAMHAGFNAFRVHVHTENPEFYEICDRLGMVVIQDNDLNWLFPTDPQFTTRAVTHFASLIKQLRNHPSVIAWIAMNEVFWGEGVLKNLESFKAFKRSDMKAIGAQLMAVASNVDGTRPVIEDSGLSSDLASGDIHDYQGSLAGGTYFDIYHTVRGVGGEVGPEKLVTEFGVDAPPAIGSLRALPEAVSRLGEVVPRIPELQDYQYRLLKYYIEHYRIEKYSPNAGYFQFMWIDFSPQSFYGVYDYWGNPKAEGLGGGLRALLESNQPIGIFMEHDTQPRALHAVNDSSADLGECVAKWYVSSAKGGTIAEGSQTVRLGPDSHQRIRDFNFVVQDDETYEVVLDLVATDGKVLAHNAYTNPFQPQPLPEGYPLHMDDELGMRLWWAGKNP
jgi:beta-mannosidase